MVPAPRAPFRPPASAAALVLAAGLQVAAAAAPPSAAAQGAGLVGPDGSLDLDRYYSAAESDQVLRELHARHPGLTVLHTLGESRLGAPLLLLEITDEATGAAADKPALYVDGGVHAGELTGSAVALHLAAYLLEGYGHDPRITALLRERAFYVRPKFNPDGSDLALLHDQDLRSSVRPVDEDDDGLADEDPPQDLDGDGWITRIRIPDPEGPWVAPRDEPRLLLRWEDGMEGVRYRVQSEGLDDDGDGRFDEDGVGGLDMNRNFPRNWEREHLQPGAGPYPLSEPETRATVEFIVARPNVVGIVHGHTSGGFVYRLPSASDPTRFPAEDLALIEHLGARYTASTGRPVVPSATHPTDHRYGTLISWGYWDQGVVGWVPEYSPGPEAWVTDYDGDGEISAREELRFDREELGGRYFTPWRPYDHPQLGAVEIGGWHDRFWGQNPPAEFLEEETTLQLDWILYLAEQSPLLALDEPTVTPLGDGRWRVEARVRNTGFQPTSLTARGAVGRPGRGGAGEAGDAAGALPEDPVVRHPVALLEVRDAEVVDGPARIRLPHLAGTGPFVPSVEAGEAVARWTVRAAGPAPAFRVRARADKAGSAEGTWVALRR